jgi:CRP-like cAMP-binding protein
MRQRDFFAFCTGLKPIELKAIGELSWVRHLGDGDVLYTPGEPGNALYIVNRGIVEVQSQTGSQRNKNLLLGRGELVGDVEVFSDIRRTQLVRAKEPASLQCFPRANFSELMRRVPAFYRYVCEQMAMRLVAERELAAEVDDSLELSGSISNFDLTTIHQTIMSSGQTGELTIRDDKAETIGAFYFEAGRPSAAQFQHLTGDEAFWQLFLTDQLTGTFSFSAGQKMLTASISAPISYKGSDQLITAMQFRDELDALRSGMRNSTDMLRARTNSLSWPDSAPADLRPVAAHILEQLTLGPRTISDLYGQCNVCELKIFRVVSELLYSDHIAFVGASDTAIPMSPSSSSMPLAAAEELLETSN